MKSKEYKMDDMPMFKKQFLNTFTNPQQKTRAVDYLFKLKQLNKPFDQHLAEFCLIASKVEVTEDHVLTHALIQGYLNDFMSN